jgi:hypothetical protein
MSATERHTPGPWVRSPYSADAIISLPDDCEATHD